MGVIVIENPNPFLQQANGAIGRPAIICVNRSGVELINYSDLFLAMCKSGPLDGSHVPCDDCIAGMGGIGQYVRFPNPTSISPCLSNYTKYIHEGFE